MLKGSEPAETIKPSPTGAVARPEPATDSDLFQNGDESFNDHSSELQEEEEENPRKRFDNATDKHSGSERLGDDGRWNLENIQGIQHPDKYLPLFKENNAKT